VRLSFYIPIAYDLSLKKSFYVESVKWYNITKWQKYTIVIEFDD